ncbi:hypothetical protein [Endozoicomonas elysicola]|uniref:CIS tube protein n=1 Tax=Endozoicomonas elysicola TaxID=305900 RepID=UPI00035D03B6|nr:hypothetical protein [Endozoicomonas elysicola]
MSILGTLLGSQAAMVLESYTDAERSAGKKEMKLPYKAESLQVKLVNKFKSDDAINTSSGTASYEGGESARMTVTFQHDTTLYQDIISFTTGKKEKPMKEWVQALTDLMYAMEGTTHEPRYLLLKWGEMAMGDSKSGAFYGVLEEMDITYNIVGLDGEPLAAEVTCTFVESLAPKALEKKEGKNSPDLTHTRVVYASDNLAYKTWEIYKDPMYMIAVARVNGLDSIRRLKTGSTLVFPPVGE